MQVTKLFQRGKVASSTQTSPPRLCYFSKESDVKVSFHDRCKVRFDIQKILDHIQHDSDVKNKLNELFQILNQYPSHHGIPSAMIDKIYSFSIEKISLFLKKISSQDQQYQGDVFCISCQLVNLINTKFPDKIQPHFRNPKYVEHSLKAFSAVAEEYNTAHRHLPQNPKFHLVNEDCLEIISFHILFQIEQEGFIALHNPKGLNHILKIYQSFLETLFTDQSKSPSAEFKKCGVHILNCLISFVSQFKHEMKDHIDLFNETLSFMSFIRKSLNATAQQEFAAFDSTVFALLKESLSLNDQTRHRIVHNVQFASKFIRYLPESFKYHEPVLLEAIENHILNDRLGSHHLMHDFHNLVQLYGLILHECDAQSRNIIINELIRKTEKTKAAYSLLRSVIVGGIYPDKTLTEDLIIRLFQDVFNDFESFTGLQKEAAYEIVDGLLRMGSFFSPQFVRMMSRFSIKILKEKHFSTPEGSFALYVLKEMISSFGNDPKKITDQYLISIYQFSEEHNIQTLFSVARDEIAMRFPPGFSLSSE